MEVKKHLEGVKVKMRSYSNFEFHVFVIYFDLYFDSLGNNGESLIRICLSCPLNCLSCKNFRIIPKTLIN